MEVFQVPGFLFRDLSIHSDCPLAQSSHSVRYKHTRLCTLCVHICVCVCIILTSCVWIWRVWSSMKFCFSLIGSWMNRAQLRMSSFIFCTTILMFLTCGNNDIRNNGTCDKTVMLINRITNNMSNNYMPNPGNGIAEDTLAKK